MKRIALLALLLAPAAADEVSDLAAKIEAERLRAHVAHLADDRFAGRLGGSDEEAEAARWIAERYREVGLAPGFGEEYVQEFPLVDLAVVDRARLVTGDLRLRSGPSLRPLGCSAAGDVTGPLRRMGEGADLRGAIATAVFEEGMEPAALARTAEEAGAIGFVLLDASDDLPSWEGVLSRGEYDRLRLASRAVSLLRNQIVRLIGSFQLGALDPEVLLASQRELVDVVTGRDPEVRRASGSWADRRDVGIPVVAVRTRDLEGVEDGAEARVVVELERRRVVSRNVVGILPATDAPGSAESLVVGAHFDHVGSTPAPEGLMARLSRRTDFIWNGADDNASGTAAVLEIARALAASEAPRRRNVIFIAFGSEEYGLLGSNWYVEHPAVPLDRTVAMLNLDMIGRNPDGPLYVAGTGSAAGLSGLLDEANGRLEAPLELRRDDEYVLRSDQAAFLRERVPALFLSTGEHPDYHESSDELEVLSVERMTEVTRLGTAILALLDRQEDAPAFDESYAMGGE